VERVDRVGIRAGKDKTFIAFGLGSTISEATAKSNFNFAVRRGVTMALFVVLLTEYSGSGFTRWPRRAIA